MAIEFDGYVARLINEDELVLNIGTDKMVSVGDRYSIIDTSTIDVPDPVTGENLGTIVRYKAHVEVTKVADRLSIARKVAQFSAVSTFAEMLAGTSLSTTLGNRKEWREGVVVGDPVVKHGSDDGR